MQISTFLRSVFYINNDLVEETQGRTKFRVEILLVYTQY